VLVLAIVGGAIGIASLVNSFQHGGLTCLPSDFPQYSGARVVNEQTFFGTGVAPGDSKSCRMTVDSNDNVATVTAYYRDKLSGGDWKVVSYNDASGQIQFQRVSRPLTVGTVELLGRGSSSEIKITLDS
jgi:predicted component of type VI protein secretion system